MMQDYWSSLVHYEIRRIIPSRLHLRAAAYILCAVLLAFLLSAVSGFAGSATWNLNPTSGDWNTAANWTPVTVPNGPNDTATFDVSNTTNINVSGIEVNSIIFTPDASAYTLTIRDSDVTISGVGITNNSGSIQNFAVGVHFFASGHLAFTNSATAGNLTAFSNAGADKAFDSSSTSFSDASSAGSGTFTNNSSSDPYHGGSSTSFFGTSTAANGTFINNGGTLGFGGAGGYTFFEETSTAGNATLIANGTFDGDAGNIYLDGDSTGGTARVEVFAGSSPDSFVPNGNLNISRHNSPGVTIGSIEGTGDVFLGANNLAVGSNNRRTIFSGVIQDGGSLTKIGTGTLILTSANTYTGGTTIEEGQLLVNNTTDSGLGSGSVQVNAGRLGGNGTIAGSVTVGTETGAGATLAPGERCDSLGSSPSKAHSLSTPMRGTTVGSRLGAPLLWIRLSPMV